jgi:uncharacterized membrane protein
VWGGGDSAEDNKDIVLTHIVVVVTLMMLYPNYYSGRFFLFVKGGHPQMSWGTRIRVVVLKSVFCVVVVIVVIVVVVVVCTNWERVCVIGGNRKPTSGETDKIKRGIRSQQVKRRKGENQNHHMVNGRVNDGTTIFWQDWDRLVWHHNKNRQRRSAASLINYNVRSNAKRECMPQNPTDRSPPRHHCYNYIHASPTIRNTTNQNNNKNNSVVLVPFSVKKKTTLLLTLATVDEEIGVHNL